MTTKIIICVTTQHAIAAVFESGKLGICQTFAVSEDGQRAFGNLLHAHPGIPVYLMVDSVEEDYHAEILPHASGSSRQELVRRKLKQLYRSTSYYTAWIQWRESDKRRDDHYMFAALTNAELLRPWLETLHVFQSPLAGVYLLPMVTQVLLARLKLAASDLLVVSKQNGGLRQSFFQASQLKASRLALADQEHINSAVELAADIGKTRLYLNSLRLMAREAKLTVLLLDTHDSMEDLQQHLQADPGFTTVMRLSSAELSARLGGVPLLCPYALHMTVLGLQQPVNNLAPAIVTRNFWRHQQRRLTFAASAVVTAAALVWAGANLYQSHQLDNATHRLETEAQALQTRYVEITKAFPQAPASAENLEKAVQLAIRIKQDSRTPEKAMLAVSRALESSPEIMLTRLSWKFGAPGQGAGNTGVEVAPPAGAAGWREAGLVEGEIRPFHGDYRSAMASVNRFAGKMAHDPEIASVSVVEMPLNIHSSNALSGNTLDAGTNETMRAEFKIKIVMKGRI
ncbi:hypothetical protein SKTS_04400 [Sulfurimicrobium lacus]|uniref:Monoheme cytochrome SoxX n=1 Tax=Sulfurimicrobium lacus TaxID=2715678 RepID=A0A6F8V7B8_9PROT|nr:hypothetical protein [Sulfurimicrobium lacus]BCB25554.1 hypothetical protein SKTS_04400 [Sulfurimicrobium lacus]